MPLAEVEVPVAEDQIGQERVVQDTHTTISASTKPSVHTNGLCWMLVAMLEASLLSAFVERWFLETSSFHLLFGEMTVTLYDVDVLFHIPIASTFSTPVYKDQATTVRIVMDALEVDEVEVLSEFGETRGFHLRMSWLMRIYQDLVHAERYQVAAIAYMLHLVACTLFADKSGVYIGLHYLSLFSAFDTPCWAWGVAALTMLYTTLDIASRPDTRQLAGYLSLLQCWIPHICERKIQHVVAADPYAKRWKAKQAIPGGLIEYRRSLDALTLDDVIWILYTGHRPPRPFDGIPRPVPEASVSGIDRWFQSHIISSPREIIETAVAVQEPGQCGDGYLEWFHGVSHPRFIPPAATSDVLGP
ncbi:protein MAIN-LIKE 2-like [Vicia villosa]|uniref:protein MAIN-LIKE 2-like n=1 Tax=Vicia villosa TaxID=3911 RepID=UPI00273B67B2|nr:protein MAIN-LIKE 2-like [Vicia villosa]